MSIIKQWPAIVLVLCLSATVVLACYIVAEGQTTARVFVRPVATGLIGRYQISGNLRIDTVTGRAWEAKRVMLASPIVGVTPADASTRLAWYEFTARVTPRPPAGVMRPIRIVPIPTAQLPLY